MRERSSNEVALADEIAAFIRDPAAGEFGDLFLRLFARHYACNRAYRVYCDNLRASPDTVGSWRDVPAVPALAFKSITLSCVPIEDAAVVFHSSGTTDGRPGKHFMDEQAASLYHASLTAGFHARIPRDMPLIALMPPPSVAPNSSLSYMLAALGAQQFYWDDYDAFARAVDIAEESGSPVCVFGTAFAFVELFDRVSGSWILPPGSYVIETGGLKGRTREVGRGDLYAMITERIGVCDPFALAEYGMSEMASQYYGSVTSGLSGGHWVRARIVDPLMLEDTDEGVLWHYDLANWNSVGAIQTHDIGRRISGSDEFHLIGRAPRAQLRGCSLSVEERWTARKP